MNINTKVALTTLISMMVLYALVFILVFLGVRQCSKGLDEKGGIRGIVISAGKTWKEINEEINEE